MYKALELYPRKSMRREYVYMTEAVKDRLSGLERGKVTVSLSEYLDLSSEYQWDLSRDINYAYAMVKYPPDEILRRLNRLLEDAGVLMVKYILTVSERSRNKYAGVLKSLKYEPERRITDYALGMIELGRIEQIAGYSDALVFEE